MRDENGDHETDPISRRGVVRAGVVAAAASLGGTALLGRAAGIRVTEARPQVLVLNSESELTNEEVLVSAALLRSEKNRENWGVHLKTWELRTDGDVIELVDRTIRLSDENVTVVTTVQNDAIIDVEFDPMPDQVTRAGSGFEGCAQVVHFTPSGPKPMGAEFCTGL